MPKRTLYETIVLPQMDRVEAMSRAGLPQRQIADNLGISISALEKYIREHAELRNVIQNSRFQAIEQVENAMFQRAVGIKTTIKRGIKIRKTLYDEKGRKKADVETIEPFEEELYFPPDTEAGKFLLKNWGKDRHYSNEPETLEIRKKEVEIKEKLLEAGGEDIPRAVIINDIPKE